MKQYTSISPYELAHVIAECSLTLDQKLRLLAKIEELTAEKLQVLYESLINLKKAEQEFINDNQRTDLKFKIMFLNEIEKEKAQEKKQ